MRRRCWRKLACCIAIEVAIAAALPGADYKAAVATVGAARALALEAAHGVKVGFAQPEFRITQALADFTAVQVMKQFEIDRAGIVLHWSGIGARPAQPDDLVSAMANALSSLAPAEVRYAHRGLSVWSEEGDVCVASL